MRVRVKPKSRQAEEIFTYHLKRNPIMYVDERRHKWRLACPTTGISFWVDPKNDEHWEVIL